MPIVIDPLNPPETYVKELNEFFELQAKKNIRFWDKSKSYPYKDLAFQFSHDVVVRPCKEGKNTNQVRYEFISNRQIGKGAYGTIYEIDATLNLTLTHLHFKQIGYQGRIRFVKIQYVDFNDVLNEYFFSRNATYLHVKYPVINGPTKITYMVMNKLNARRLNDIIEDDRSGEKPLSPYERLRITRNILRTVKWVVMDNNAIHRDLNDVNILISDDLEAYVIDFGFATSQLAPKIKSCGMIGFMAPEIENFQSPTSKCDMYSLGITFFLLWGVDDLVLDLNSSVRLDYCLDKMCSVIVGLVVACQIIIMNNLKGMLCCDPDNRSGIEDVIAGIDQAYLLLANVEATSGIALVNPERMLPSTETLFLDNTICNTSKIQDIAADTSSGILDDTSSSIEPEESEDSEETAKTQDTDKRKLKAKGCLPGICFFPSFKRKPPASKSDPSPAKRHH
jgi:serine/threonine protein kinase